MHEILTQALNAEDTHVHFINMERPGDFKRVFTYDEVI
jgi:hypothetical protein